MTVATLTRALVMVGAFDASGNADTLDLSPVIATKPVTTFASGGFVPLVTSLKGVSSQLQGFNDFGATALDQYLASVISGAEYPISVAIPGTAVGDPAHFTRGLFTGWKPHQGAVGDVARFDATFGAQGAIPMPEVRGWLGHALTAETTTANGTAVAQAGPTAAQKLWAAIHVTTISGTATPTLTVKVQSDDAVGFPSSTDRITFTAMTAVGWQIASVAGNFSTETHLRFQWTISGTNPSFTWAGFFGVAAA